MRYRSFALLLVVFTVLPACFEMDAKKFANLSELVAFQREEGYVLVNQFGDAWPAEVTSERYYQDTVNVILANQEMQEIDGFDGYKLKVVTLKGDHNAEIVVVFLGEHKE
jgi:hypothetical protein